MMELSLLKSLLISVNTLSEAAYSRSNECELIQKYHQNIEEILKLFKPIFLALDETEIASYEVLQNVVKEFRKSIDELRELFENWQFLMSKIYFVLQVESLTSKVQTQALKILELLKSSNFCLPSELTVTLFEFSVEKVKLPAFEEISSMIKIAIKDHMEGSGASPKSLEKISDSLSLKSNQELLIEAVALEKLRENAEEAEKSDEAEYIEQIIALVTHIHELLVMMKQSQTCTPVPIPADFCCPLSLELMTDPVIVASGQTYERAFIREWIDLGLTVCPKTRHTLTHTNLIPNYTVKALIANWCESHDVKLPHPPKFIGLNKPISLHADIEFGGERKINNSSTPDRSLGSQIKSSVSSKEGTSAHPHRMPENPVTEASENGNWLGMERLSSGTSEYFSAQSMERSSNSAGLLLTSPSRNVNSSAGVHSAPDHSRTNSASSALSNSITSHIAGADSNAVALPAYGSDASGELSVESQPTSNSNIPLREADFPSRIEIRNRVQTVWRKPSDRFVPRVVSSSAVEMRADLLEVETQVKKLVEELKSNSLDLLMNATEKIRLLAKHNMDNRIIIANCGTIILLVNLLQSEDSSVQENAVTALLNLSINDNNKNAIVNADAIEPLIHVLKTGSPEAKENSAATLFSLSVIEENKIKIGKSGAIMPLVDLLGNGTPRGKKDAATALFNLSINHENKARIVQAGAVKYLIDLMDPAFGMVDKAVAVLSNLATIHEGRASIGQEGGIRLLVEVVELGSVRGKEFAAAALLQLCTNSSRFCNMILQEGAVPPLVALSQSGTPRAREKSQQLLAHFRNRRHGNSRG